MNRCAARGCGRWTRADETFCQRHRGVDQPQALEQSSDSEDEAGRESFAARLSAGDYASLLPPGLRDALRQASADAGLEAEIGALRVALLRLLQEERDPSRMAAGIARVAGVALQALRMREAGNAIAADLRLTVVQALLTIEAEAAQKEKRQKQNRERALEPGGREGGDDRDPE